MNRRNFLSLAALAIAGKAAERVFPFRVYSIPKKIAIVPSKWDQFLMTPPEVFMPPLMFGGITDPPITATGRGMTLYSHGAITPEMFRRAQKQIMERLGASPLEINSYPLP